MWGHACGANPSRLASHMRVLVVKHACVCELEQVHFFDSPLKWGAPELYLESMPDHAHGKASPLHCSD
jgi:hypothetical protein